jgi:hypothetical protein
VPRSPGFAAASSDRSDERNESSERRSTDRDQQHANPPFGAYIAIARSADGAAQIG